jgi:alpha-amylase/alpha-mannosidase (GH57 family)
MSDPIYLNILWHQHQPLYKDTIKDTYTAPWG